MTLDELMSRAEGSLAALQTTMTTDAGPLALQFGYDVHDIGLELAQRPELAAAVRAFVERTAPIIQRDTGLMFWFHRVYDAAGSRSSETDVYTNALVLRSSVEFFRDLYRDSVASALVAELDMVETDRNLKEWGANQWLDDVPEGYPPSHTWWHQSLSGK